MDIEIIILLVCLALSAFFSSAETAFVGLSRIRIQHLIKQKKKYAHLLLNLKKKTHSIIITILIGNNVANILASAIATRIATREFGSEGIGIAVGVMTFLILLFGEIIPKSYATTHAEHLSRKAAPILYVLSIILWPLIVFFSGINKIVFKLFGGKGEASLKITEEDVIHTIALSEEDGGIESSQSELLHNVFEFKETTVEEIMTPREQVSYMNIKSTFAEIVEVLVEKGLSRVPIYKGKMDNIVGTIHIKDMMRSLSGRKQVKKIDKLIEKPLFVPEMKSISTLLREFQRKKIHMAIVVNEHGGWVGIITMEDLLEELVGEIYDETDVEETTIEKISSKEYIILGHCLVEHFNTKVKKAIPDIEDYQTISGFLLKRMGRMLKKGDKIRYNKITFTIDKATDRKIKQIHVRLS